MNGKKILLGIVEDKEAYKMVDLAYELRAIGYETYILRTNTSENHIPMSSMDDLFYGDKFHWDLLVLGPCNDELYKYEVDQDILELIEYADNNVIFAEDLKDIDSIVEQIQVVTKGDSLCDYSFLITLGYFNEHLTNNHYIGTYSNDILIEGLIKELVLSGAHVSVVASDNIKNIKYVQDVILVSNPEELETVVNSKYFKYDVVINAINIPRFGLSRGERFKIEYQRYFAEFEETYLPFTESGLSSDNQLIVEVLNGHIDNEDAINYLFDNTSINMVMLSEMDDDNRFFKPFVKLINKDGTIDVMAFKNTSIMYKELISELKAKLEEQES